MLLVRGQDFLAALEKAKGLFNNGVGGEAACLWVLGFILQRRGRGGWFQGSWHTGWLVGEGRGLVTAPTVGRVGF
ncbi:MAG: hypothetical protein ABFD96_05650 [Armatimonadia bacterium]